MPLVVANGLKIEVEQHGNPSDPALLMVMGLGAQLVHWPPAMIEILVSAGYRVITFDNRDIGLSEQIAHARAPSPALMLMTGMVGLGKAFAPYDLSDMAADTIGILDALDIDRAHLLGASMGGMIGQLTAARYGDRLLSFTSIMSSTNNRRLPRTDRAIVRAIIGARSTGLDRDEVIERTLGILAMIGTPDGGRTPAEARALITAAIDRSNYAEGVRRQIAAIVASGDLRRWARQINTPTLVVHGKVDPLTPYQGSVDIAQSVRGARLEIIEGMGHDLPPKYLDHVTGLVVEHLESTACRK